MREFTPDLPAAASIAGSDCSGGAGIQADLLTFAACGVRGATVVTAVTAQDSAGVTAVAPVPLDVVARQIDAVVDAAAPAAWKTGMLVGAETVAIVAQRIEHHGLEQVVVDPVIEASSGHRLLSDAGVATLRAALLPLAFAVTPNLPEAERLLGMPLPTLEAAREAAVRLTTLGPRLAVVTGGHRDGAEVVDVVHDAGTGTTVELRSPRHATGAHGTGCVFSAALAAFLARGVAPLDAASSAHAYVQAALRRAQPTVSGRAHLGLIDPSTAAPTVPAPH